MAHYWLAHHASAAGTRVAVSSAGVRAREGAPAAANAVETLKEAGVCPAAASAHAASRLDAPRAATARHVVCMTEAHKAAVAEEFPDAKVSTLLSQLGTQAAGSVDDPVGEPLSVYAACLEKMLPALRHILSVL